MPNTGTAPDMGPFENESAVLDPQTVEDVTRGSLQEILSKNCGNYVVCEFLIGTVNIVTKEGILYDVGNNFLAIYDANDDTYTVCDYYSLKFLTFYPSRNPQPIKNEKPHIPTCPQNKSQYRRPMIR